MKLSCSLTLVSLLLCLSANAAEISIPVTSVETGQSIGYIEAKDTQKGVELIPNLSDLPPGMHGMHIHQYPACSNKAEDAGSHWDPKKTDTHKGPYKDGHLGDLPALVVDSSGKARQSVIAPHLDVKELYGHSLIIHAGGDDYSDTPPMGGGGARIACGVIS